MTCEVYEVMVEGQKSNSIVIEKKNRNSYAKGRKI
jgi:hypothetical protein